MAPLVGHAAVQVSGLLLIAKAGAAVVALVALIARFKLNPFLALVGVSLVLGVAVGLPMATLVKTFEAGVGDALGHIALVVGLGAMLGKMMAESGAADRIAQTLVGWLGPKNVSWAMMIVAFIVGLPVFFEVGFVLLIPIVFTVAKRTGTPILKVGLPMAAGLSVVHGLVPPHPAAMYSVTAYGADIGRTILYALIVGVPVAVIAGPLFSMLVANVVVPDPDNAMAAQFVEVGEAQARDLPGFAITLFTVLLPVALMLAGSWADAIAPAASPINAALKLTGHPVTALLIAVLVSFYTFGKARGFSRDAILTFTNDGLAPTAMITLVVGAGAGFGRVLMAGGVSNVITDQAAHAHVPLLVLSWTVAALLRVATGSATVASTTAAGVIAPIAAAGGVRPELLVLTTGAGALILSHVNDGGFWLVKSYFNMTVTQTLKTWTVCETLISVLGLLFTLMLAQALKAF